MTSLLEHSDTQVTEHIFLPKKWSLKHYFYLLLMVTWVHWIKSHQKVKNRLNHFVGCASLCYKSEVILPAIMLHVDRKICNLLFRTCTWLYYTYFLVQGYSSLCKNTVTASFQKWNEKVSFSVSKVKFSIFCDRWSSFSRFDYKGA